jgi:hypothetical protein
MDGDKQQDSTPQKDSTLGFKWMKITRNLEKGPDEYELHYAWSW